ncbi:hypothetical protein TRFO_28192 [Tritrichomonas foetus]|uniref:Protein kinase domain-containing protein n=1 Tax=Tritrichomonas foetus TaxID=1144522 RepID=A0A1J4K3K5_9EUKA|nr:hypothetical protein TRFO_28192 [Tritrichomonas foetus]|eukprot:OHT04310.1 hypothetical protein TRFO_28192 [Tritrichomonas foetus]
MKPRKLKVSVIKFLADLIDYTKVKTINRSDFAKVVLVKNKETNKLSILKSFFYNVTTAELQNIFVREAYLLQTLQFPSLLPYQVFSFMDLSSKAHPSFLFDYYSKGTLLDNYKNLNNTKKMIIIIGVAEALRYLHYNKIEHASLNPSNILLDENYYPYLTSYGLSRLIKNLKKPVLRGHFTYLSPNSGSPNYGFQNDIFSFSMVLYLLIAGEVPFGDCVDLIQIPDKLLHGIRPPQPKGAPADFILLINECWDAQAERRPSFDEISQRLKTISLPDVKEDEIDKYRNFLQNPFNHDEFLKNEKEIEKRSPNKAKPHSSPKKSNDDSYLQIDDEYDEEEIMKPLKSKKDEKNTKYILRQVAIRSSAALALNRADSSPTKLSPTKSSPSKASNTESKLEHKSEIKSKLSPVNKKPNISVVDESRKKNKETHKRSTEDNDIIEINNYKSNQAEKRSKPETNLEKKENREEIIEKDQKKETKDKMDMQDKKEKPENKEKSEKNEKLERKKKEEKKARNEKKDKQVAIYDSNDFLKQTHYDDDRIDRKDDLDIQYSQILEQFNDGNITHQDSIQCFKKFLKLADQNHSLSCIMVGECYEKGKGIQINPSQAFNYYMKAGKTDIGLFHIAQCYENGIGTDIDLSNAINNYKASINFENSKLMIYRLSILGHNLGYEPTFVFNELDDETNFYMCYLKGMCYEFGYGTEINENAAFELYSHSFEGKEYSSAVRLSICYLLGLGTKQNHKKALKILSDAQDNIQASIFLSYLGSRGIGGSITIETLRSAYYKFRDLKSISWEAHALFGLCTIRGIGVKKDRKGLEKIYAASKSGDPTALVLYGRELRRGKLIDENKEEAISLFKEASMKFSPLGMTQFGKYLIYEENEIDAGVELIKKAATFKYKGALCHYGKLLLKGIGVDENKEEAIKQFKKAIDLGSINAKIELGKILSRDKDIQAANKLFESAADQGSYEGMYRYAKSHLKDSNIPSKVLKYLKMAADSGHAKAANRYGEVLTLDDKTAKDAARYYKMAADANDANGLNNYGSCLYEGWGEEEDFEEAVVYLKRSAEMGNSAGMTSYGLALQEGKGVKQDLKKAKFYFKKAAEMNNESAQYNYAMLLKEELGDDSKSKNKKSAQEALKYLKLSADSKFPLAMLFYGMELLKNEKTVQVATKYLKELIGMSVPAKYEYTKMQAKGLLTDKNSSNS